MPPQVRMTTGASNTSEITPNGLSPINEANKRYINENMKISS